MQSQGAGISGNVSKTERIIKDRFLLGECGIYYAEI